MFTALDIETAKKWSPRGQAKVREMIAKETNSEVNLDGQDNKIVKEESYKLRELWRARLLKNKASHEHI